LGEKKTFLHFFQRRGSKTMEDLYKNLTDLASSLSQEYDPETSYSPFREVEKSDESYSPSRTYDDPKCAIIFNEYDPLISQNEGVKTDFDETKPKTEYKNSCPRENSLALMNIRTDVNYSRRSGSPYNPRTNVSFHEPREYTNSHLPMVMNAWTPDNHSKRSRSPSFKSSYDEYNPPVLQHDSLQRNHQTDMNYHETKPRKAYNNSHRDNSLALMNIRTDANSSKRSRSPSFKSSNFQNKRQPRNESRHEFTAFVCNIAFTISEEELKEFFESKVRIQSFKLVDQKNEQGKLCKRFAFVSTFTETDFQTLLSYHDVKVDNRKLCIRKSDKK
jgi:hypothetical protein